MGATRAAGTVFGRGCLTGGAPGRIRTRDPLITNQVLYQLSYKGSCGHCYHTTPHSKGPDNGHGEVVIAG